MHRDVACRNILVAKRQGEYVSLITDFGGRASLAVLIESDRELIGMSRHIASAAEGVTGDNFGPAKWMSPEALQMRYSEKSDVW